MNCNRTSAWSKKGTLKEVMGAAGSTRSEKKAFSSRTGAWAFFKKRALNDEWGDLGRELGGIKKKTPLDATNNYCSLSTRNARSRGKGPGGHRLYSECAGDGGPVPKNRIALKKGTVLWEIARVEAGDSVQGRTLAFELTHSRSSACRIALAFRAVGRR